MVDKIINIFGSILIICLACIGIGYLFNLIILVAIAFIGLFLSGVTIIITMLIDIFFG